MSQPRRILFKPERSNYVRKVDQPKDCVFCSASKARIGFESLCVFKSKHSMVVINKFPYNSGHILVIPQAHIGDFSGLSEVQFLDLQKLLKLSVSVIQKTYKPQGINVGLNMGAAAGAGLPDHLHYHVIPRWTGDLNFFPLIADTKVVIETLEMTFKKLHKAFK